MVLSVSGRVIRGREENGSRPVIRRDQSLLGKHRQVDLRISDMVRWLHVECPACRHKHKHVGCMVNVRDEDVRIEQSCRNTVVAEGVFKPEHMRDLVVRKRPG